MSNKGNVKTQVSKSSNQTDFARPSHLPGLELVSASYSDRSFPAHAHPEFVIGAISAGAERLTLGDREAVLIAGDTLFLHPGEVHANASIGAGRLRYDVFYIPEDLLRETLAAGDDGASSLLTFSAPCSSSNELYLLLMRAHLALRASDDALLQQSAFVGLVSGLTEHFGARWKKTHASNAKVALALDYLRANFRLNPGLSALAEVAGLSPFHLLRSFKRQVGLSPVAYRNLLRVMAARDSLRSGESLAASAIDAGFADQSHMTRAFHKVMGATPGHYARQ